MTTVSASPIQSASPSIAVSKTYATWRRVEMPDPTPHVYGGEWAADLIAYRGGYLAVGFINGGCCDGGFTTDTRAVVWTSPDGASWQLEPNVPAFALGHMVAAATDGHRIVVVGFRMVESVATPGFVEPRGAAWTSTDGSTWVAQDDGLPQLNSVVFWKGRFVATGNSDAGPEIWSTTDGTSWAAEAQASTLGPGRVIALHVTSVGLVAIGFAEGLPAADGSATSVAVTWLSTGTGRWQRSPDQVEFQMADINDVTGIDGRLVAIGHNWNAEGGLFWASDDGLSWTRIDDPSFVVECAMPDRLIAGAGGLLAIGTTCSDAHFRTWTSADGVRWSIGSASQLGLKGSEPQVQGWLLRPDSSLLAVGYGASAADPYHVAPMAWLVAQ